MISLIGTTPETLSGFVIIAQKPVCFSPGDGKCEGIVAMGYRKDTDEWGIWTHREEGYAMTEPRRGKYGMGEYFFDWPAALRRFNERDY